MKDFPISTITRRKLPVFFISPHLDDAVLSAGGIMASLSASVPVTLITVFTKAGRENTLSAKRFLQLCKELSGPLLYRKRIREDRVVSQILDVKINHLGFVEALWRKKKSITYLERLFAWLPEIKHTYAAYFFITRGRVAKDDKIVRKAVANKLRKILPKNKPYVIFSPIGTGNHVDHVLTRGAIEDVASHPIYWIDLPYAIRLGRVSPSPRSYKSFRWIKQQSKKKRAIAAYGTQVGGLFAGKEIPDMNEMFYCKEIVSTSL